MPVYLAICFLFHTYIGLTALVGAIILITLTVVDRIADAAPTGSATQFAVARNALMEASRRNAEAITAMGMVGRIAKRWSELNRNYVAASGRASDVGRRPWRGVEGAAAAAAVRAAWRSAPGW